MTQGFDEYLDINYNEKLDDLTKFLIHDAYKAGAASRQAEIYELQRKLDYSERLRSNQFEHLEEITAQRDMAQRVNRELQKRIDDAATLIRTVNLNNAQDSDIKLSKAVRILLGIEKGESNE